MPSPLSRTFTDSAADGTFRFTSLAGEGKLMVVGAAQGYPNAFTQANAGDTDVRVVLRRGATLDVRIVSDAGEAPIVGAQVLIAVGEKIKMDDGPGSLVGGLTDASGSAVLEVFPGEIQMAIVSAPGFPPNFWDGSGRSAGMGQGMKGPPDAKVPEGRTTITFRMPTGVKLKGKVMDTEGGPLAGVEVVSLGFLGNGDKTVSGIDGAYELNVITAEFSMGVTARLPGWVQDKIESPDDDKKDARAAEATEKIMDIRMRRAITVAGRVLDPEGRPVAGATVTVRPVQKEGNFGFDMGRMLGGHANSITLANGTYAVDGVPSDGKVRVFARREGFVDGGTEPFEVGKDLAKAPDVRLLAGANLDVKVLGPDGQGVGGARVRVEVERADKVQADDWESMMERESGKDDHRTGATGAVELTLLPPGKVTLRVTAAGFAPSGAKVTIGPDGGPKEPLTVRLKPGITISGRVLDGDGQALEGAVVRLSAVSVARPRAIPVPGSGEAAEGPAEEQDWVNDWDSSRRTTTGALGQWSVKDLPEKQFEVRASKDGYGGGAVPVGEDRTRVEVRLVKQDPEAVKRIAEIDKELQALYGQMRDVKGEAQEALFKKLRDLQEERRRLSGDGN
jgi:protocatechuate 3,4-dioxygenase beta subunit